MHRFVLGISESEKVKIDHIDRCGGNNQKNNLRIATSSQNMMNRCAARNTTSKYKGVYLKRKNNRWAAQIKFEKHRLHIGYFSTEDEAALAYNKKAIELHGEFASLNNV
jgi:hypothetical protein